MLTLRLCIVIFSTSGRKSKPEVGLPHTISVLFQHEILPADKENDLESNTPRIKIGETGNTDKNGFPRFIRYDTYIYRFFEVIYRVDSEIMLRHIFDFRSEVKTGSWHF